MTIADRMAVFMEGCIEQVGAPDEVFATRKPSTSSPSPAPPPINLFPATNEGRTAHTVGQTIPLSRNYGSARDAVLGIRPAPSASNPRHPALVYLVE